MKQHQREALFDLILISSYLDCHISLIEEELMQSAFIAEGWESEHPKELYLENALAHAREAAESDDSMAAFVEDRASVFTDRGSQVEAYGVLKNILERDGLGNGEPEFLALFKQSLPNIR